MLYNIYHGYSSGGFQYNIGVNLSTVTRIVEGFLRGNDEIKFEGRAFKIGDQVFQVFEVPSSFNENIEQIKDYYEGYIEGIEGELAFSHNCKNVTSEFLNGRERGDLVDYFNIYVHERDERHYIIVVSRVEIENFLKDWENGLSPIWVAGRSIELKDPETIKIFDIKLDLLLNDRGHIKQYIRKVVRMQYNKKWCMQALEDFGKDVTGKFTIKPFGFRKLTTIMTSTSSTQRLTMEKSKIFISHSSKDKEIVREFVNEILVLSLGTDQKNIFCTSIEGLGITSGEDFRKRIKAELELAKIVIQVISKNYKSSEVCLNEMGAAWVLATNVIPLVIDGGYDIGFINNTIHQLNLGRKEDVLQFIDDWEHLFPRKAQYSKINGHVDKFLKIVHSGNYKQVPEKPKSEIASIEKAQNRKRAARRSTFKGLVGIGMTCLKCSHTYLSSTMTPPFTCPSCGFTQY